MVSSSMGNSARDTAFQVPGTTVFVGRQRRERASIDIIDFSAEAIQEWHQADVATCLTCLAGPTVSWINVNGVHDIGLIEELGDAFHLHPLTREDIANTSQRPKWEEFGDYAFLAMKMLDDGGPKRGVTIEHVSLILGPNWVLSFLEDEGDVFESVRKRLRTASGRVRTMPADYLAFCLMDAVVDHYFLAVERIGEGVELIDEQVISNPSPGDIHRIHRFKQQMLILRRAVWPLREVVGAIVRSESELLGERTKVFWRDLYDHTVQVIDNGPGIPDSVRDRVFYPLVSGRDGGSGLGLTLAQTFINQHHGTIEFDSLPGRTCFTVTLPFAEEQNPSNTAK